MVNGRVVNDMDEVDNIGVMDPSMRVIGTTMLLLVKVDSSIPMETSMRVNGPTIKHMDKDATYTAMEPLTMVIGLRISSTDLV